MDTCYTASLLFSVIRQGTHNWQLTSISAIYKKRHDGLRISRTEGKRHEEQVVALYCVSYYVTRQQNKCYEEFSHKGHRKSHLCFCTFEKKCTFGVVGTTNPRCGEQLGTQKPTRGTFPGELSRKSEMSSPFCKQKPTSDTYILRANLQSNPTRVWPLGTRTPTCTWRRKSIDFVTRMTSNY